VHNQSISVIENPKDQQDAIANGPAGPWLTLNIRRSKFVAHYFQLSCDADLESAALASVPLSFRIFRFSLPVSSVDRKLRGQPKWELLKPGLQAGDKLWPFEFNRNTLAMRKGFILLRRGKVHSVLVTELS
jgi:hypothetical protein